MKMIRIKSALGKEMSDQNLRTIAEFFSCIMVLPLPYKVAPSRPTSNSSAQKGTLFNILTVNSTVTSESKFSPSDFQTTSSTRSRPCFERAETLSYMSCTLEFLLHFLNVLPKK